MSREAKIVLAFIKSAIMLLIMGWMNIILRTEFGVPQFVTLIISCICGTLIGWVNFKQFRKQK